MSALRLLSLSRNDSWRDYTRGFEAGLVGGLADWFAVTALFRHPMGIPIPHTALLPKNRKRVTKGLINTLENEWLTKESITNKVKEMQLAQMVLQIAEREMQSDAVKRDCNDCRESNCYNRYRKVSCYY